mgnify:CR=1 FL=1
MQDFENLVEVQTDSQEIFDGAIVHLYKDTVTLPNGHSAFREVIRHVGAVCVIPVTDDGMAVMERQYRYPVDEVILHIYDDQGLFHDGSPFRGYSRCRNGMTHTSSKYSTGL